MQKKFLTNLGLLLLLNFLVKPLWIFGIDRTVQNIVGAADYGTYFSIFNFTILFNILLDFGITTFNNRNIAQNNQLLNKHFSGILMMKILLGFVYFFIIGGTALLVGYNAYQMKFLFFLGVNQLLTSLILYLRSNISGLLMFKTESLLSVLDKLLMILFCSILLWGHITKMPFRIEWFVYCQTSAYLLTTLIALTIVIKKAAFRRLNWSWPFFLMIIKQSFPFALLTLLMAFYNRVDSVMLERMIPGLDGEREVGIYASAFRLLDASTMFAYLFAVLLLPIFSKMLKDRESIQYMVKLSSSLLLTVAIITAVGSWFYSQQIMELLYTDHVDESARVFRLLMGCFIPISATYIFGTLLTANGNLKAMNIMAGLSMFLNLLLNIVLIPQFKSLGSAYASLTTQLITAVLQIAWAQKVFRFKPEPGFLLKFLLFIPGVILLFYLSFFIRQSWLVSFGIAMLMSVLYALILRLLSLRSLMEILRKE